MFMVTGKKHPKSTKREIKAQGTRVWEPLTQSSEKHREENIHPKVQLQGDHSPSSRFSLILCMPLSKKNLINCRAESIIQFFLPIYS